MRQRLRAAFEHTVWDSPVLRNNAENPAHLECHLLKVICDRVPCILNPTILTPERRRQRRARDLGKVPEFKMAPPLHGVLDRGANFLRLLYGGAFAFAKPERGIRLLARQAAPFGRQLMRAQFCCIVRFAQF